MSEVKRYRAAALGELPACAHWSGPDVVLASDYDQLLAITAELRAELSAAIADRDECFEMVCKLLGIATPTPADMEWARERAVLPTPSVQK